MSAKDDDIREVQASEKRRGIRRRPVDAEKQELVRRAKARITDLYNEGGTIEELKSLMITIGLKPNSPAWNATLDVWRSVTGRTE